MTVYGNKTTFQAEIDAKMREALESGQYVMGPILKKFEGELAQFHGTPYAVGVGNGTDALFLTFKALGIGPDDECITATHTFFATAEAIWPTGATVVFVDSDPRTNCIDPNKIEVACRMCRKWTIGGGSVASERTARTDSRKC